MPNPSMIDFGAFRREHRERTSGNAYSEPIVLNINEVPEDDPAYDPKKVYTLPAIMPGMAILEYERISREYGGDDAAVPDREIFAMGEALFPPNVLRSLTGYCGLDSLELGALIMMVFAEYRKHMEDETPEAPEGNAGRPKKKGRRLTSSKTGRSSKATASASTA